MARSIHCPIEVVLNGQAFVLRRRRSLMLSRRVAHVHRENPLLPVLPWPQSVNTVLAGVVLEMADLTTDMSEEVKVLGQRFDPLEIGDEAQWHESLRVHMFPEEQVLAQVVNREVVLTILLLVRAEMKIIDASQCLQLHRNHAHQTVGLHVRLVRHCRHGSSRHWLVSCIHGVDIGRIGENTIHSRIRQRRRAQRNTATVSH